VPGRTFRRREPPPYSSWEILSFWGEFGKINETIMHDATRVGHTLAVEWGVLRGLVTLRGGAPSSSSPTPAARATAGYRMDRRGEALQQAAQLANWEDEGGTISG